jgi:DNA-binding NtrC family response regulator
MRKVLLIGADGRIESAFRLACVTRRAQLLARPDPQAAAEVSDLALCVLSLQGRGDEVFERVRALSKVLRGVPLVLLGRGLGEELAFRLARLGVADLIVSPADPDDVARGALAHLAEIGGAANLGETMLVGDSPAMVELRRGLRDVAQVESKVLLQGETGTGKGVAARLIHDWSRRRERPFVHVDCAALSPTLIESELFGHEKGAFTGAASTRRGRFELAAEGTIFLDEIGDLDPSLQTKLLRALEDRAFERVGGTQSLPMTARVISATSRDLHQQVRTGSFRQDLYYRLNVLRFDLPPLRERLEDLSRLVEHGLRRISATLSVPTPLASGEFLEALGDHPWPGNVRELMNLLERLLVRRRVERLEPEDLDAVWHPEDSREERAGARPVPAVDSGEEEPGERELIREALLETGGNVSRAARRLGMRRGTLRYKIRRHGLTGLIPKD